MEIDDRWIKVLNQLKLIIYFVWCITYSIWTVPVRRIGSLRTKLYFATREKARENVLIVSSLRSQSSTHASSSFFQTLITFIQKRQRQNLRSRWGNDERRWSATWPERQQSTEEAEAEPQPRGWARS